MIINQLLILKAAAQSQALKLTVAMKHEFAAAKTAAKKALEKREIQHMLVANFGIPVIAYAFLGLTRIQDETGSKIAFGSALVLLTINIFHALKFPSYRGLSIALFVLNAASFIFLSAVSFIDGLYFAIPLVFQ